MNQHELPMMFPAVLDGTLPLDVFADMVMECGYEEVAMLLARLDVIEVIQQDRCLVVVRELDFDDRPTGNWQAATRNDAPLTWLCERHKHVADWQLLHLAVHWVAWTLEHGEVPRDRNRERLSQKFVDHLV